MKNIIEHAVDPLGMLDTAYTLDIQIEQALKLSHDLNYKPFKPKNIIMLGLGGSAIGGEVMISYFRNEIPVPIIICREYEIPGYVGKDTLCLAVSYSGNTEETLSSYDRCKEQGAYIIAIATGGKLEEKARKDGYPFCSLPVGYQPRAALTLTFTVQMLILSRMGLVWDRTERLQKAVQILRKCQNKWRNPGDKTDPLPLELARQLKDKIPVVYGSWGFLSSMAYRWKCQFNENAKIFASHHYFPELNHNEIVGWEGSHRVYENMCVLLLRTPYEPPRIKARVDLTRSMLEKIVPVIEIFPQGENSLEHLYYYILLGDLTSIYLAYLYGRDPGEIDSINRLKEELDRLV